MQRSVHSQVKTHTVYEENKFDTFWLFLYTTVLTKAASEEMERDSRVKVFE